MPRGHAHAVSPLNQPLRVNQRRLQKVIRERLTQPTPLPIRLAPHIRDPTQPALRRPLKLHHQPIRELKRHTFAVVFGFKSFAQFGDG